MTYKPSPAVQKALRAPYILPQPGMSEEVREAHNRVRGFYPAVVPEPARAPLGAIVAFVVGHAAVGLVCLSIVSGLVVMLGSLR